MYSIELRQLVTAAGLARCTLRSKAAVMASAMASASTSSMNSRLVAWYTSIGGSVRGSGWG
jgi:hypothetical protein